MPVKGNGTAASKLYKELPWKERISLEIFLWMRIHSDERKDYDLAITYYISQVKFCILLMKNRNTDEEDRMEHMTMFPAMHPKKYDYNHLKGIWN